MISKADLKLIKALKLKKYRTKERKFLVEGIKSVNEVIQAGWQIDLLLASASASNQISKPSQPEIVDSKLLHTITQLVTNQDCLAVVKMPLEDEFEASIDKPNIVLDGIQDPGNFGTIIRTLDWFGFNHIICSEDTVDFYNSKTLSSTMGSFTRVKPYYINIKELFSNYEWPVYGMDLKGEDIRQAAIESPSFIVMGNESKGIRDETHEFINRTLRITGSGKAESLNVAIATGILLHRISNP